MDMMQRQFLFIRRIDSDTLKAIAVASMLIDHIGAALLLPALSLAGIENYDRWHDIYSILREIGRAAFPIFAFLLVEGLFHTHDRKRYFGRLFLFALLSEIPFDMAFHGTLFYEKAQNVFWTLAIGFFVIWRIDELYRRYEGGWRLMKKHRECIFACMLILAGWFTAVILRTDYKGNGILLIVLFYFGKHAKVPRILTCIIGYLLFLWEPYCVWGFLLILFYNGARKPRRKAFQYFFYLFYPMHLLILGLARMAFLSG